MSKVIHPCFNSCFIITMLCLLFDIVALAIIMHKYFFQIRFGDRNIRKVQRSQDIQQILQVAAIQKTYGIPVCLYRRHAVSLRSRL